MRSSPAGGSFATYSTLLLAFSSARRSLRITNPYFLLDGTMRDVVIDRVRRGVTVEVLVPGTIDHKFVRQASRATWGPLLEAGVKFFEYRPALLHAKTIVIDGMWATVGSTNLDNRSFAMNEELNVIVYDRDVGLTIRRNLRCRSAPRPAGGVRRVATSRREGPALRAGGCTDPRSPVHNR